MTRPIVCAVDERTPGAVVSAAAELASGLGASLVLTHSVEDPRPLDTNEPRERQRKAALGRGYELLARNRGRVGTQPGVRYRVELGAAKERLLDAARDEDAELVVAGRPRRGVLASALLGSVSRSLLGEAPCPVVVVGDAVAGHRGQAGARSSVVCGVDGSTRSIRAALLAADLARRLGDRLVLVHAYESAAAVPPLEAPDGCTRPAPDAMRQIVDPIFHDAEAVVTGSPPNRALESVASREGARLLVVGPRSMGAVRAAVVGSVTSTLIRRATCPVLALPESAELARGTRHYAVRRAA